MKTIATVFSLAVIGAASPAQDVGFQVATTLGSSGQPCDPWTCTPATVDGAAGTTILLRTRGGSFQPHFLLVAAQTAPCVTIAGFGNALLVDGPVYAQLLDLAWAMIYVSTAPGTPPACGGRIGSTLLDLPAGVPIGTSVRMQLLAPLQTVVGEQWTFSKAVDLTIG